MHFNNHTYTSSRLVLTILIIIPRWKVVSPSILPYLTAKQLEVGSNEEKTFATVEMDPFICQQSVSCSQEDVSIGRFSVKQRTVKNYSLFCIICLVKLGSADVSLKRTWGVISCSFSSVDSLLFSYILKYPSVVTLSVGTSQESRLPSQHNPHRNCRLHGKVEQKWIFWPAFHPLLHCNPTLHPLLSSPLTPSLSRLLALSQVIPATHQQQSYGIHVSDLWKCIY